jgi:hypothetical protein
VVWEARLRLRPCRTGTLVTRQVFRQRPRIPAEAPCLRISTRLVESVP